MDLVDGHQQPMVARRVSGLPARPSPALLPAASLSLLPGQPVGGGWLGGVGGVLPARRQLPLQIGNLLLLLSQLFRLLV